MLNFGKVLSRLHPVFFSAGPRKFTFIINYPLLSVEPCGPILNRDVMCQEKSDCLDIEENVVLTRKDDCPGSWET